MGLRDRISSAARNNSETAARAAQAASPHGPIASAAAAAVVLAADSLNSGSPVGPDPVELTAPQPSRADYRRWQKAPRPD